MKKKHMIAAIKLLNPHQTKRALKGATKKELAFALRHTALHYAIGALTLQGSTQANQEGTNRP